MERGLLSDPRLAELHDDVVWMYLFQDFSGSAADRAAQRVAIRFGITSWPQHFLVDPHTLAVLADTGRSLDSLRAAIGRAAAALADSGEQRGMTPQQLAGADARAARLEGDAGAEAAKRLLDDPDVVVRYRAIERLEQLDPDAIVETAGELLGFPHDQTRFLVCKVLERTGAGGATRRLEQLVREPAGSKNPNVLRIHAVRALARCGDAASIEAIAPFATSGEVFNGLTGVAVDALATIAERLPEQRDAAAAALRRAFPPPAAAPGTREQRATEALARRVHAALSALTGAEHPFPDVYDAAARRRLVELWR